MFHLDDRSNFGYSPLSSYSGETSHRRESTTDAGYCSNNSTLSSPDTAALGLDADLLSLPSSILSDNNTMDFENSRNMLFSLEKPTINDDALRRISAIEQIKSASLCYGKTSKFVQSENSAFSPSPSRMEKSHVNIEEANAFVKVSSSTDREVAKRFQAPKIQYRSVNQGVQFRPSITYSQRSNDLHDEMSAANGSHYSDFSTRPDYIKRQHSDSLLCHQRPPSLSGLVPSSSDLNRAGQYFGTHDQDSNSEDKSNAYKLQLDDLGFMDPSLLTLSPNNHCKSDLRANDTLQTFFESSQSNFRSPVGSPTYSLRSPKNDIELEADNFSSNRTGDNRTGGIASSVGGVLESPVDPRFSPEDEAWRSYLENPVTAATTALMSIQGDEDSAAALGILYDYYKVPREKRVLAYQSQEQLNTQSRCSSGQNPNIPDNPLLANDVTILSPLSTSGSRGIPLVNNQAVGTSLQDDSGVLSPIHLTREMNVVHSNLATLTSVKLESSGRSAEISGTSSDYLNIGQDHVDEIKRNQLTPDSAFSETKDSSPQTLSFGDYGHKMLLQPLTRTSNPKSYKRSVSTRNNNNNSNNSNDNTLITTTTSTNQSQQLGTQMGSFSSLFSPSLEFLPTDYIGEPFEYVMEAPKSLKQKEGEPTMSYINKGQFYCISLRECGGLASRLKNSRVTSVVQVVFGDGKPEEEQLKHWKYWHARQHTAKQRIIDIADYKESRMISDIDEFAHNAIRFSWDVNDVAKIFVSCNCLSTDFSAQKGIKGLPLLMQIDTYIDNRGSGQPDHRGVCQLKVFCDKGAERKIRDEERKAMRRKQKTTTAKGSAPFHHHCSLSPVDIKPVITSSSITPPPQSLPQSESNVVSQKRQDTVYFKTVTESSVPAVYFIPDIFTNSGGIRNHVTMSPATSIHNDSSFMGGLITSTNGIELEQAFLANQSDYFESMQVGTKRSQSMVSSEDGEFLPTKMPRICDADVQKKVLLYVRKETDDVYDGVMLREPSLKGLKQALQEKYEIPAEKINKVLKKSKKGILVNIDDNIVQHYSNEDIFVIDITAEGSDNNLTYKVILSVV